MTMLITARAVAVAATPTFRRRFTKLFFLLGCSQAGQPLHGLVAGRALVGDLAPPSRVAEFLGPWGLSVKAASFFGPLT